MKNIRLPGTFWAGLVIAAAAAIHTYIDDPLVWDVVLAAVMAALKALSVNAETPIGGLLPSDTLERSADMPPGHYRVVKDNKMARWFWG